MDHASPEDLDHSESESIQDENHVKTESNQASPSADPTSVGQNDSAAKPLGHLQKRRRVTRACDECRRKKIKCDGKQPCTHCTVYSYECTYDQPSNRRRNPAPQYVENLEHRVHRAESLLHILIPNLDLSDPGIDAAVAQGWIPGAPGKGNPTADQSSNSSSRPPPAPHVEKKSDTNLESMMTAAAQLDIDETGNWDYHGHSSGFSFVRRMREQLGDLLGPDTPSTPFVKTRPMSQVLDSPCANSDSPVGEGSSSGLDLPPKEMARQFCIYAMNDAAALLRMLHQPTFWDSFERIYATSPDQYTNDDNRFLPLFYSAVALGTLFGKDDDSLINRDGYESAIQQGFTYFKTARSFLDIADCRDLTSIQAVLFMILFLQSSAKMSQCYAYVGVALRSAIRLGLHRAAAGTFNPVEAECRKRVFWVVRKMDVYVAASLGLPQTFPDDDQIDQEFPEEVDDEYITKDGILPMPDGVVSLMTAFNAHTRLVLILQKIVRKVYPIKVQGTQGGGDKSYSVSISTIREIEGELEEWKKNLPSILTPCDPPARYARIQQLLRLSYAHAQVLLYRPFLHYTAMEKRSKPVDQRAYACAASFVNVSRNIVHIASQMKQKGLLNGAFWFIMYTTFFSILALVYFAAENPDNPTTEAVMKDAIAGREVLKSLSSRSMAADRCTATLDIIFQRLPTWMREGQQNPSLTKKRTYDQGPRQLVDIQGSRSHTDLSEPEPNTKKANTFPTFPNGSTPAAAPASPYGGGVWPPQNGASFEPLAPTSAPTHFEAPTFSSMNQRSISHPLGSAIQQFALPPNFANPQIADLSTMMFPTADEPFVYPNQPLTTFENARQFAKNNNAFAAQAAYGNVGSPGSATSAGGRVLEENIEAQFFTLPPYIEQRQQQDARSLPQGRGSFHPPSVPYANGQGQNPVQAMHIPDGQWQQGLQQALPNIDIQSLFGGAESGWNSMYMNAGYQNQQQ